LSDQDQEQTFCVTAALKRDYFKPQQET